MVENSLRRTRKGCPDARDRALSARGVARGAEPRAGLA